MFNTVDNEWTRAGKVATKSQTIVGNQTIMHTLNSVRVSYTQQLRSLCTAFVHMIFTVFTTVAERVVHAFHRAYKYNYSYIQYN